MLISVCRFTMQCWKELVFSIIRPDEPRIQNSAILRRADQREEDEPRRIYTIGCCDPIIQFQACGIPLHQCMAKWKQRFAGATSRRSWKCFYVNVLEEY